MTENTTDDRQTFEYVDHPCWIVDGIVRTAHDGTEYWLPVIQWTDREESQVADWVGELGDIDAIAEYSKEQGFFPAELNGVKQY